jgi:dTDP-4-dehydrorhamnose 3,5-epimerase
MRFIEQALAGVFLIELEPHADERGFFARTFAEMELAEAGLHTHFPQGNVSWNAANHTLRGMHYQAAPHGEVKIVSCTAGAIFDVAVDLRAGSPTRFDWLGIELTPRARNQLYIPAGFAHGFLTLEQGTEVSYRMGTAYVRARLPHARAGNRGQLPHGHGLRSGARSRVPLRRSADRHRLAGAPGGHLGPGPHLS